jgi:hypothetical protein
VRWQRVKKLMQRVPIIRERLNIWKDIFSICRRPVRSNAWDDDSDEFVSLGVQYIFYM